MVLYGYITVLCHRNCRWEMATSLCVFLISEYMSHSLILILGIVVDLQVQPVSKNKLQLVGVTSMLIAAKYEEMYPPEIGDFVYITDNAYTKAQIRSMECNILRRLDFNLGKPLCIHFLRRNSKAGGVRY